MNNAALAEYIISEIKKRIGSGGSGGNPHTVGEAYSAILDLTESDPDNIVSYADKATGIGRGWTSWKDTELFRNIKPCVLKDGEVMYYLNPDDYSQKADYTTASEISELGYDVMIEIPRMGYSIEWQDSARTRLKVSVTLEPSAAGFCYDAFSLDSYNDCDKLYIGAYKGYVTGGKMYSSPEKTPASRGSISDFRGYARARGNGYQQRSFGSLKLMQCLYLIAHGNLDSQAAVGRGYCDTSNTAAMATGGANASGFDFELAPADHKTSGTKQVKCLGIEDFWGNISEWIDGLASDGIRNVLSAENASQFNNAGTTYINNGNGDITSDASGYMTAPQGGSLAGFVCRQAGGLATTRFCDNAAHIASAVGYFGGMWNGGASVGAFTLSLNGTSGQTAAHIGARLIYLHKQT